MHNKTTKCLLLCAAIALPLAPAWAQAQEWPNGNLEVIIPSSPGGGFDTYARVLARAMEEDIGVSVVPTNVSGGAGMRGAQAAFQAQPNGQTFAIFNVPGIIEPIINGQQVAYNIEEIDWVGAMAFNQYIVVVAADSPYNTIEDLKAAGETIRFTGYGASGVAANKILCSEAGLDCQIISGYPGNNDALLGVVRGDAAASVTPITTATSFNASGDLKGLLLMSDRTVEAFPDTQTADEAGYPALSSLGLIRAFGLPPGVPAEIRAQFQQAYDSAVASEMVTQWSVDTASPVEPLNGEELKQLITDQTALLTRYQDVISTGN